MKIKRFLASEIRQAMRQVREELGADAVILSNRSVPEGVEIVAARDFDEQIIRDNLEKQAQDKKPDPVVEKKIPHIISSRRKRELDGSLPKKPLSPKIDSYVGYAERPLVKTARHLPENKLKKKSKRLHSDIQASNPKPKQPVQEELTNTVLLEMRRELKYLRKTLDEKLAEEDWMGRTKSNPTRLDLLKRLTQLGLSKRLAIKIANRLGTQRDPDVAWEKALQMLVKVFPATEDDLLEQGGFAVLIGPTGVGKTTTIAKLAARSVLKHGPGQVALVTTDNYRIAAHEQLKTYGRILGVPVSVASSTEELENILNGYADKRFVLIDTAGMSQRDMKLAEQINILQECKFPIKPYLVMSATTQAKAMDEIIEAFSIFEPVAAILTKIDETAVKGHALSALIEHQLPLNYIADGQHVPEDLQQANVQILIDLCLAEFDQENDYNVNYEIINPEWVTAGHA